MQNSISESTMVVRLSTSTWSARKSDDEATKHIADTFKNRQDVAKVTKKLLECDELDAWRANRDRARRVVHNYTTPYLDEGERLLPMKLFDKFIGEFREYDQKAPKLKAAFLDAYPVNCKEMSKLLGRMYHESDYPSVNLIASKFQFDIDFYAPRVDARDWRLDLEKEYVEEIKEKLTNRLEQAHNIVLKDCWKRILDTVTTWYERASDEDAVLREATMVTSINSLVEILPALNVSNDPVINNIVEEMRITLTAFDLEELRYDCDKRADAAKQAGKLLNKIRTVMPPI